MKITVKIATWILLVSLSLSLLTACADEWDKTGQEVIGKSGEYEVYYEELRFVTLYYKDVLSQKYGEGIWNDPATAESHRKELEDLVWDAMKNNYTVLAACEEYRITKEDMESDAIQDAVDKQIKEARDAAGNKKAFREELKKSYVTEHFMRFSLAVTEMEYELYYVLVDDLGNDVMQSQDAFYDWLLEDNAACVQHLFIRNDPGDSKEENLALAKEAEALLRNAADAEKKMAELIGNATYNEDPTNTSPYFIVRHVYDEAFEKEAMNMTHDEGLVSSVVETEEGYYVLVSMKYDTQALLSKLPDLHYSYRWARVEETVQSFRDKVVIELNEYGKSIDLLNIQ